MITEKQIQELNRLDKIIQKIAKKFKLDFYPQEFDIISSEKMIEILSYFFPITYHHWSGGRDYERAKTLWRYDRENLPYEVVFNTNPCRAYLCETDPFVILILTMAHVYAHNNFFKNNRWSKMQRSDINRYLAVVRERFEGYEKEYGLEAMEKIISAALSIQFNIDPFFKERPDNQAIIEDKIQEEKKKNPKVDVKKLRKEFENKIPFERDRDLIGFIAEYAPNLESWQRDILNVVREQTHYLLPNVRTRIMNEGWAAFWHEKIMEELIKAQLIKKEDREIYMQFQSRVLASHPMHSNPYLMGREIWKYIERQYGLKKAFEVRDNYRDIEFVEDFLADEVIHDLQLYIYEERKIDSETIYVIIEKRPSFIRKIIAGASKRSFAPTIYVVSRNYNDSGGLLLWHDFDEERTELDVEYRQKTMEHLFELWGKTIWLFSCEIVSKDNKKAAKSVLYSFDGEDYRKHMSKKK